jgi:hypothetical protein
MNVAPFVAAFVVFVVAGAVLVARSDRRRGRAVDRLLSDPSELADSATSFNVASRDRQTVLEAARRSIKHVGGRSITTHEDRVVIGWAGLAFTNIPALQQYQLVVAVSESPGGTQVLASARPRFSSSLGGRAYAQTLAQRLAAEIYGAMEPAPTDR